jgi:MipA family protein
MRIVSGVLASLLALNAARADELFPALRKEPIRWGLGVGALVEDEGYRGIGSETEPVPALVFQHDRWRIFLPQAEFRVIGNERTALSLRADYRFDGFEAADGPIFEGMAERKGALSVGIAGRHAVGAGELSFDFVRATSSERGMRGGLYYTHPFSFGRLQLLPRVGLEYFDADFVRYYYGVRAEEARADRPFYEGDATLNVDTGVDVHYNLSRRHSLIGSVKYRIFGSEIKDSPLVDASGSPRVNIGYLFKF